VGGITNGVSKRLLAFGVLRNGYASKRMGFGIISQKTTDGLGKQCLHKSTMSDIHTGTVNFTVHSDIQNADGSLAPCSEWYQI